MIVLTEKASKEIRRLISEDPAAQGPKAALRVSVVGGGCSGMSYKLSFDADGAKEGDHAQENDGLRIVVDSKSFLFLKGMVLDFSDGLNGTGFVFNNPNAKRTCGCGTSFSA
jgi:iron-sulfur cluster assembly protein